MKNWLISMVLVAICATNVGCRADNDKPKPPDKAAKTTQQQVEAIAKNEVARRGWKDATVQDVRLEGNLWTISLIQIPAMPGGHAVIKVSDEGTVISFVPGA
ncbi:MAG: hypothetical protein ABIR24_04595 [Verrucomicrobiota bacterium]